MLSSLPAEVSQVSQADAPAALQVAQVASHAGNKTVGSGYSAMLYVGVAGGRVLCTACLSHFASRNKISRLRISPMLYVGVAGGSTGRYI